MLMIFDNNLSWNEDEITLVCSKNDKIKDVSLEMDKK